MFLLLVASAVFFLVVLYLNHVNNGMKAVPDEVVEWNPRSWTDQEILDAYNKVSQHPPDYKSQLPPKLDRRYVVVGGSGLVGGHLVLHLLLRGQSPESIRNIDFRKPTRDDLTEGDAAKVEFVQADISSLASVKAAFARPWPESVAHLPMTVIQPAAVIRPHERHPMFYHRCAAVNVNGTRNVMAVAKSAGADVFMATSSASISLRPVNWWIPPWKSVPDNLVQVYLDPDKDENIRPHNQYFSLYSMSKAHQEDLVLKAHSDGFRTGCIRPACGVYGFDCDIFFSPIMRRKSMETWFVNNRQNFVSGENVALAHLLQEKALIESPSTVGGKTHVITDPNPLPVFKDMYRVLELLNGCYLVEIPPIVILIVSYIVEAYSLMLGYFPFLEKFLPYPRGHLAFLHPSVMSSATAHQLASDAPARKSVEEGGLGYKGVGNSLEGVCYQVWQHNKKYGKP